jgi:hypothetical protein
MPFRCEGAVHAWDETETALRPRAASHPACGYAELDVEGRGNGPGVRMPLTFTAFCSSRHDIYARYAAVRTGSADDGARLARTALDHLAMVWPQALQGPSPAALAWHLLTACARHVDSRPGGCALYDTLPAAQADALVLRYRLGLAIQQSADVMGISVPDMTTRVRFALRAITQ